MRRVNKAGIDLIKSFEGLFLKPYLDPIKIPTIGYGTIVYENGNKVTMQDPAITEERALQLLQWEVDEKAANVERMVKVQINDNEFAALSSFAYNVGWPALEKSTLMKLLNSNADRVAIADQFLRWNKAGGQELPGLTRRRQAERSLFLQPMVESSSDELLPSGPSDDDINEKLKKLEDEIMKK
jgi:lysozyme